MKKLKIYLEVLICIICILLTIKYSIYALDKNCISLYYYSDKDLSDIYKDKTTENLWFIANKIKIMGKCKQRNYDSFLKEVSNNNDNIDFAGYDWFSKGKVSLSELAKNILNKRN